MSRPSALRNVGLEAQLEPGKIAPAYTNALEEYWTVRRAVGLADISHLGRLRITGKDRISFLNGLLTNDVSQLKENGGQRTALLNSLNAGDGCIQFSRSSSLNTTASTPSLTYVPYAIDAVSYAVTANSALPRSFNLADLQHIYQCDPNYVGTGTGPGTFDINPVLPQSGSGTRSYWEGQMGITDATLGSCIINGVLPGTSTIIEEHTGTFLKSNWIAPFSVGQYASALRDRLRGFTKVQVFGEVFGFKAGRAKVWFELRDAAGALPCSMWREDGSHAPTEVSRGARFYISNQIEAGHNCPITMTRACVAALAAEPEVLRLLLPKIRSRSYDKSFRPWW